MWKTQKRYEETITVRNEQIPQWSSGGIATVTVTGVVSIKAVMLPDDRKYKQSDDGDMLVDMMYAHVRKDEMAKADMIPGKTKIIWNGDTWRVIGIVDYRTKARWQNAEIQLVKHIGVVGTGTW